MTDLETKEYKKAYVELNEIIKLMPPEEKKKIPKAFIENLNNEMDKNYTFFIDSNKSIYEQDYKVETKALLVELYERYLALEDEKEFWRAYDKLCFDAIQKKNREIYNPDKIFEKADFNDDIKGTKDDLNINDDSNIEVDKDFLPLENKKTDIFTKFIQVLKKFFHITKN